MYDAQFMRLALRLARRGYGTTSPNPMVGAVLVKGGKIIGRGWHRRAGLPHAEIEALLDAKKNNFNPRGATPYVTVKAGMTLDGKIATANGESKWITGEKSRTFAMKLRQGSDAILVGIN